MRGIKRAILAYLVENGKSGAGANELAVAIGQPVSVVIIAMKEIFADDLGIDYGSKDGQYIVLKTWAKDAYEAGIYDDPLVQPEPAPIGF